MDEPDPVVRLASLGWDEQFAAAFAMLGGEPGLQPGRVAIEFNHLYRL